MVGKWVAVRNIPVGKEVDDDDVVSFHDSVELLGFLQCVNHDAVRFGGEKGCGGWRAEEGRKRAGV